MGRDCTLGMLVSFAALALVSQMLVFPPGLSCKSPGSTLRQVCSSLLLGVTAHHNTEHAVGACISATAHHNTEHRVGACIGAAAHHNTQ